MIMPRAIPQVITIVAVATVACVPVEPTRDEAPQTRPATSDTSQVPADKVRQEQMKLLLACDAAPVQAYVGSPFANMSEAQWLDLAGAGVLRVVRPGEPLSRDFRTDRLTVALDEDGIVRRATCG